jgi:uncharacterized membrane protein YfcA
VSLTSILAGFLVGFLVGLTGVGGGSVMTPYLVSGMGVSAPIAIGTDMIYSTVTKLVGSVQHYRQRSVNLELALFMGLGSIPASLLGVRTLQWIKGSFDPGEVQSILITIISITLVVVGASLVFRAFMPGKWTERRISKWDGKGPMSARRRVFTVIFGATGGYLVGLTSIGSGSIMAVILLLLYPLSPAVVVGTDVTHATVLSLVTGVAQTFGGNVDFPLTAALSVGGIPGVLIGSRIAPLLPSKPLTVMLAVLLVIVGARTLFF